MTENILQAPEIIEENTSPMPIYLALINFLRENDLAFIESEENGTLGLVVEGNNGRYTCYAIAREKEQQMIFYSLFPINVPEAKRLAIAEFITKANYGMMIGNFELDFQDGEIRFKTSIDVENDCLTSALIKNLVAANLAMMDHYMQGLMSVIYGNVSPDEAIAQIE
ncbi:YbjN domain-containing protein [Phormidium pseudopriestleyi FRX01]|uniref:YbjN domain-containing protein n=1 Tax=Phormidium pseudopriestleyi FRX01 TaxID=1759528 RepID=A0ABS3FRY7_9CYAN|nr:YbjN domain-containing protein [Phormidium pseudopriestleyi]MBO0349876.1 YbjN domain-containing protein [Phormidium pseudopriestleyi FRX01]